MRLFPFLALSAITISAQHAEPRMSIFDLKAFKYESLEIMLPKEWSDQSDSPNAIYIEARDKSKGVYFMSLSHPDPKRMSVDSSIMMFIDVGEKARQSMKGYHWVQYGKPQRSTKNGVTYYTVDHYDQAMKYFIHTLLIARPGAAARFAFHDYNCSSPASTLTFFDTPIRTIRVSGLTP